MKKNIIMDLSEKRRTFFPKVEIEEYDCFIRATVDQRKKALKKFVKMFRKDNVIVSKNSENNSLFAMSTVKYCNFSKESVIPVLPKVIRQAAQKYNCNIPFEEIFIVAENAIAYKTILELRRMAHIFSVISQDNECTEMIDELYFEHSVMSRRVKEIPSEIKGESVIICFDRISIDKIKNIPVINSSDEYYDGENVINLGKISVNDAAVKRQCNAWGGKCGLAFIELCGVQTGHNSIVDINNFADEIFLLDTERI